MKTNNLKSLNKIINNQKLIYSIYAFVKSVYGNKRGRKYKVSLIYQIVITIFKLRYNLPDRVLEGLLKIDHVTISRIVQRISLYIGNIKLPRDNKNELNIEYYVVDTTTIRIGKSKNKKTYSGYKNYHGVKYQLICDSENKIKEISRGYEASIHDKKVFIKEYEEIKDRINQELEILGDKAYVGLEKENVKTSSKRNEIRYKEDRLKGKENNKLLNKKRVKIEHIFANIKNYRILRYGNYYAKDKLNSLFKAICVIYNLSKIEK